MDLERPHGVLLFRWVLGLLLILGCGWGCFAFLIYLDRSLHLKIPFDVAGVIWWAVSFFLFFLLEKDLWLSRFMGLRLSPHSSQLKETLFFWLLGFIGLLIRSSDVSQTTRSRSQEPVPNELLREILETIVFVVVLVLLLKSFVAEAFVIPTGSMATTLLGYNKDVTCPECGLSFPVNCSKELDEEETERRKITGCTCPNCRYHFEIPSDVSWSSGDRVLVTKFFYDSGLAGPKRHHVVVFKYPERPVKRHVPHNYIKRLIGLPGETLLIYYGKIYVIRGINYAGKPRPEKDTDLWKQEYMYMQQWEPPEDSDGDDLIRQLRRELGSRMVLEFDATRRRIDQPRLRREPNSEVKIELVRKAPEVLLALRRLVYDNDHQASDLKGVMPPRWAGEQGSDWKVVDNAHGFRHRGGDSKIKWLRYRHIVRPARALEERDQAREPELITDFLAYNTYDVENVEMHTPPPNWVGDLILEARVNVENAEGEFWLELAKGVDRFQACWELATGTCTLYRVTDRGREKLASQETRLKKSGEYLVRFANVDERLTVWVDKSLPFGDGVTYAAPARRGPTANDLQPASIGTRGGAVEVHELKLWRDSYYTIQPHGSALVKDVGSDRDPVQGISESNVPDAPPPAQPADNPFGDQEWRSNWFKFPGTWGGADQQASLQAWYERYWKTPSLWQNQRRLPALSMYVHPEHYLCLGDNSPESSDGRTWGTVPERLLLGRALMVYYPFYRAGRIR